MKPTSVNTEFFNANHVALLGCEESGAMQGDEYIPFRREKGSVTCTSSRGTSAKISLVSK